MEYSILGDISTSISNSREQTLHINSKLWNIAMLVLNISEYKKHPLRED